ncbi:MAG TPA: hypothetical protein VGC06_08595 [Actinomycetes bacterium]
MQQQITAAENNTILEINEARRRDEEAALQAAYDAATTLMHSLADRTRTYTQSRYDEAVRDQKYWNLSNDCERELANVIPRIRDPRLRETLLQVPSAFEQFAQNFARRAEAEQHGQPTGDPKVWASTIRAYTKSVVEEIMRCRAGEPLGDPCVSGRRMSMARRSRRWNAHGAIAACVQ